MFRRLLSYKWLVLNLHSRSLWPLLLVLSLSYQSLISLMTAYAGPSSGVITTFLGQKSFPEDVWMYSVLFRVSSMVLQLAKPWPDQTTVSPGLKSFSTVLQCVPSGLANLTLGYPPQLMLPQVVIVIFCIPASKVHLFEVFQCIIL